MSPLPRTAAILAALLAVLASATTATAVPATAPEPHTPWSPGTGFDWPLRPEPPVARPYDPPADPYGSGHRGVDLAAAPSAKVHAAGSGVVIYAGPLAGRPVISIRHAGGLRTTYEPVEPTVSAGDRVRRGEVIGSLAAGHPGCPARACLHWGMLSGREYLAPILALRGNTTITLKPWHTDSPAAA